MLFIAPFWTTVALHGLYFSLKSAKLIIIVAKSDILYIGIGNWKIFYKWWTL